MHHASVLKFYQKFLLALDGNYQRYPQLENTQRLKDYGALNPRFDVFIRVFPSSAQIT